MAIVFDFDARWDEVVPHLNHPTVVSALNTGMTRWCREQDTVWTPYWGPWSYSKCEHWKVRANEEFNQSSLLSDHMQWCHDNGCPGEDEYGYTDWMAHRGLNHLEEVMDPLYPQRSTPDWYRCHGASHELAAWNCALGMLIFPNQRWRVSIGSEHSCAYSPEVYMDILWSQQTAETIALSILGRDSISYTFDEYQELVADIETSQTIW